jgi:hypothetical protein
MKLQFKNVGQYCEELSSRYEAVINSNLSVRVFKCSYNKQWNAHFISAYGYALDSNENFDYYYSDSKKETVERVIETLMEDMGFLEQLNSEAMSLDSRMIDHVNN